MCLMLSGICTICKICVNKLCIYANVYVYIKCVIKFNFTTHQVFILFHMFVIQTLDWSQKVNFRNSIVANR